MSDNKQILVVEGSRTQAELLKLVLQTHGYQVTVATDGTEAVTLARSQRPALILSGVALSGLDGYALSATLKQHPALKAIPVILLTALADVEDLMRGIEAEVDYVIAKPYQEEDLLARIAAILAGPVQQARQDGQEQLIVSLRGKQHVLTPDRPQLLRLLLSTYENYTAVLQQNRALTAAHIQLKAQHQQLQEEHKSVRAALSSLREHSACGLGGAPTRDIRSPAEGVRGWRILVAEDNPVNRTLLVRLLEKFGYGADVALNGREVVEACAKMTYAAVLMDVQLPLMSGFEATGHIRQYNATQGIRTPIIAVTAHTLPGDRERCLAAGMDDYLPKPVKPEMLRATLARWLAQPASRADSTTPSAGKKAGDGGASFAQAGRVS